MKKNLLLGTVWILFFSIPGQAQTQELIDSLHHNLQTAQLDTAKVDAMLSLSAVFRNSDRAQATSYAQQALKLSRDIQYIRGQSEALFNLGAIQGGQSDYKSALEYYQRALQVASNTHLKREPIQYKLNIGVVYDITGEADKAMEIYDEVLEDARAIRDTVLETSAFQNMAILHIYTGELQTAKDYFMQAKEVVERIDHPEMLGQITNNLASVYSMLYEFDTAKYYYQQTLELWKKRENNYQVARVLYNMAIDELETGSSLTAQRLWEESLALREGLGDARGVGLCQSALGSYYSDRGDYARAIDYFQQSLVSFETAGLKREIVSTYTNMALAQRKSGDHQQALQGLQKALALAEQIEDLSGQANALHHLGAVEFDLQNLQLAEDHLQQSVDFFTQVQNWEGVGKSLHQRGKISEARGFGDRALGYYQQSWETYNKVFQHHEKLAEVYNSTSNYFLKKQDLPQASNYHELALKALIPEGADMEKPLLSTISLPLLLDVQLSKARILEAQGSWNDAYLAYGDCFKIIDSLKIDFRPQSQQLLLSNAYDVYEGALGVIFNLYQEEADVQSMDRALTVMEGYKGLLLNEALYAQKAIKFAGIPESIIYEDEAFKNRLGFFTQKLMDNRLQKKGTPESQRALQQKLFEVQQAYDEFKNNLQSEYPNYYFLRYQRPQLTINEINQTLLDDDHALLEYFLGEDHLYILAVNNQHSQLARVEIDHQFTGNLGAFYGLLSNSTFLDEYEDEVKRYAQTAYQLYGHLVKPVESVLQNRNLIVIPDGQLHYIPFAGLLTEPAQKLDFVSLPYLVRKMNVSYYYSAGLLAASFENRQSNPSKSMLALTPENDPGSEDLNNLLAFRDASNREIGRIPGAYYEVTNIGEMVGADYYTGPSVSESNFKQMAGDYRVLHLAMHGVVDNENPNFSRLIFNADNDTLNDGLLHTYELYNMQLGADLVVLSACNTGYGALQKGEGILSLGRSFAYAGCPSILMSKWPAADQPTNELMQYFYAQIKDGVPKDEALRQAKLQYLNSGDLITSHPVFWANFVLVGNQNPVELSSTNWITWTVLGGVLITILVFLGLNARKRKAHKIA